MGAEIEEGVAFVGGPVVFGWGIVDIMEQRYYLLGDRRFEPARRFENNQYQFGDLPVAGKLMEAGYGGL